jgi:hypothetical protein
LVVQVIVSCCPVESGVAIGSVMVGFLQVALAVVAAMRTSIDSSKDRNVIVYRWAHHSGARFKRERGPRVKFAAKGASSLPSSST